MKKITYSKSGVNYQKLDPVKKLAQHAARGTAIQEPIFEPYTTVSGTSSLPTIVGPSGNFIGSKTIHEADVYKEAEFKEIKASRGESAFVWEYQGTIFASVVEGLGTKNLVADHMRGVNRKTYYDIIGHDTVATIINDLITVGAKPRVIHAYWAIGNEKWLEDKRRLTDLRNGWRSACKESMAVWGGGETPVLKGIIEKNTIDLGGSAIGVLANRKHLVLSENIQSGDRIILIKSNGINANGLSLARTISKKLPQGYKTKISKNTSYGEAILQKTNIYAKTVNDLLNAGINIHYISNITGHGLRKIMRAKQNFSYVIERVFPSQEIFLFIQKHSNLSDYEMYGIYNMGQDYAIFLPQKDVKRAQEIIKANKFESLDAGYVNDGPCQVIIKPKKITFKSETLDLR